MDLIKKCRLCSPEAQELRCSQAVARHCACAKWHTSNPPILRPSTFEHFSNFCISRHLMTSNDIISWVKRASQHSKDFSSHPCIFATAVTPPGLLSFRMTSSGGVDDSKIAVTSWRKTVQKQKGQFFWAGQHSHHLHKLRMIVHHCTVARTQNGITFLELHIRLLHASTTVFNTSHIMKVQVLPKQWGLGIVERKVRG